jgi:hypothetical protein
MATKNADRYAISAIQQRQYMHISTINDQCDRVAKWDMLGRADLKRECCDQVQIAWRQ